MCDVCARINVTAHALDYSGLFRISGRNDVSAGIPVAISETKTTIHARLNLNNRYDILRIRAHHRHTHRDDVTSDNLMTS